MNGDPHWSQKLVKKRNREKVLHALVNGPLSFTQLKNELGLSKPVVSNHLSHLTNNGFIIQKFEKKSVVYKLTEQAFEIPSLRALHFEISVYRQILNELISEKEVVIPYVLKKTFTRQDARENATGSYKEKLLYWDLKPEYLDKKSEIQIIQAIEKWLTPFILYVVVQELKSGIDWTQAVSGLVEKLQDIFEHKDITKLEEALRTVYSDRVSAYNKLSVIDNLGLVLENSENRKKVYDHFTKVFEDLEKERDKIRW